MHSNRLAKASFATAAILALGSVTAAAEDWDDQSSTRISYDHPEGWQQTHVEDLRVTVGVTPRMSTVRESQDATSSTAAQTIDANINGRPGDVVDLLYVGGHLREHGGFLWGVGAEYVTTSFSSPGSGSSDNGFRAYAATTQLGYGYGINDWLDLELTGYLALGTAQVRWEDDATLAQHSDWGYYARFGVRLGANALLARHLVLGVQGGYGYLDAATFSTSVSSTSTSTSVFVGHARGPEIQGVLGVRF